MPFELAPLGFSYDALAPTIDELTLRTHHGRHHAAHIAELNAALSGTGWEDEPVDRILAGLQRLPVDRRAAVRQHAGGHANHLLYWQAMTPRGGGAPHGELADAIRAAFGSFEALKHQFTLAAAGVFGSGWVWLVDDGSGLAVLATGDQDSPLVLGATPLLAIDLWEHAYYLKFRHRRADYVEAFWNVVDWDVVAARWRSRCSTMSRASSSAP
jgi:superoxide dismutase, Fe-Mn family